MPLAGDHLTGLLPRVQDLADPGSAYVSLLRESPLFSPDGSAAMVARHRHVTEVFRHPMARTGRGWSAMSPRQSRVLIMSDPPDHTRLRGLMSTAFTPARVEAFRSWFAAAVDDRLDALAGRHELEMVSDFALPLPVAGIGQLLGIPEADRPRFARWTQTVALGLDSAVRDQPMSSVDQRARRSSLRDFRRYIMDLAEHRRAQPTDDLFSDLALAAAGGDRLSPVELVRNVELLLFAGHDTSVSTIARGAVVLAEHPEYREQLAEDLVFAELFTDEVLRLYAPLQMTWRWAAEQIELDDGTIPQGTAILLCMGAANLDPERFPEPGRFDPHRVDTRRHLAFGWGIHRCLGAGLARMEASVAFTLLARRLREPQVNRERLRFRDSVVLQQLSDVPMTVASVLPRTSSA